MQAFDLSGYDGVLAFGAALAEVYRDWGWGNRVFVWHEAADTRLFRPPEGEAAREGLVWIGNWGDGERSEELREFLLEPARSAGIALDVHGVRYPPDALEALQELRRALSRLAPERRRAGGIRPASRDRARPPPLLCGRPPRHPDDPRIRGARLRHPAAVLAPWEDAESLFHPGRDYLVARSGDEMARYMRSTMHDPSLRASLAASGLATIRARHTCAHRARRAAGHLRPAARADGGGSCLMRIAFYGSSLLSSYWNGAATYYRGLLAALAPLGHHITFYEPDAFERQAHRDIEPPDWARVVVYQATSPTLCARSSQQAARSGRRREGERRRRVR